MDFRHSTGATPIQESNSLYIYQIFHVHILSKQSSTSASHDYFWSFVGIQKLWFDLSYLQSDACDSMKSKTSFDFWEIEIEIKQIRFQVS